MVNLQAIVNVKVLHHFLDVLVRNIFSIHLQERDGASVVLVVCRIPSSVARSHNTKIIFSLRQKFEKCRIDMEVLKIK